MEATHSTELSTRFSVPLYPEDTDEVFVTMIPCREAQVEEVNLLARNIYRGLLEGKDGPVDWIDIIIRDQEEQVARSHAEWVLETGPSPEPDEYASPFLETIIGTVARHAVNESSLASAPCRHVRDTWLEYGELKGNLNLRPFIGFKGLVPYWLSSPRLNEIALMVPSASDYH